MATANDHEKQPPMTPQVLKRLVAGEGDVAAERASYETRVEDGFDGPLMLFQRVPGCTLGNCSYPIVLRLLLGYLS